MKNNMYEVAVALAPKQSQLIDYLVEDAVIVKEIPFQAATHGIKNVFERVKDVTGPTLVDLDAPLPLVTALTELGETPLFKIGGKLEIGKDKAEAMRGKEEYPYQDREGPPDQTLLQLPSLHFFYPSPFSNTYPYAPAMAYPYIQGLLLPLICFCLNLV